jgi:formylglycine-generating enzyme required for sulfatase activity
MIALSCAFCQKKLTVKDRLAGKQVSCPGCGHVTLIPPPAEPPSLRGDKAPGASAKIAATNGRTAKHASPAGARPSGRSRSPLWLVLAAAAVAVLVAAVVVFRTKAKGPGAQGGDPPARVTNRLGMEFALVPRGKAWLDEGDDQPRFKEVDISQDFYLGVYEVTQEEWEKVMGKNPSLFQAEGVTPEEQKRFPVESVTWSDAQLFAERVNEQAKEAGWAYRLPSEEEWEYACRGGPMTNKAESAFDYYLDKPSHQVLPGQANFGGALQRPCPVGTYAPNRLGLYDMHGNVWEWCQDEVKDSGASKRVSRGGSWYYDATFCRAASRWQLSGSEAYDNLGLRLARVPVGKER